MLLCNQAREARDALSIALYGDKDGRLKLPAHLAAQLGDGGTADAASMRFSRRQRGMEAEDELEADLAVDLQESRAQQQRCAAGLPEPLPLDLCCNASLYNLFRPWLRGSDVANVKRI